MESQDAPALSAAAVSRMGQWPLKTMRIQQLSSNAVVLRSAAVGEDEVR